MPKTHIQKRLRHAPDDMLALVSDVENYPKFISLISAVRILERREISNTCTEFTADVAIQYKFIRETFRSKVRIDRVQRSLSIERAGHGGAVRALSNIWTFLEREDGSTLIDFKLDVSMKSTPIEFLIKQKFSKATDFIMAAFEARAGALYETIGEPDGGAGGPD